MLPTFRDQALAAVRDFHAERGRLKADAGIAMGEEHARAYLDAFFAGYPALNRWRSGRRGDGKMATRTLSGRRR